MKNLVSRRLRVSLGAAAAGVSLVVTLGACSSGGGSHNESTAQVCTDVGTQFTQMEAGVVAALGANLADPSQASAADQAKMVTTVKAAFTAISKSFRDESGKASDPALAKALSDSADEIDTFTGKINTVDDLQNLNADDSTALNSLSTYCPNAGLNE